jgi:predicted nucleic acid-binding protein
VPFVADNSVVIAWFSRSQATQYTDRFYDRLRTDDVIVPAVWPYEFANAVAVLERRKVLTGALADAIVASAGRLITRIESPAAPAAVLLAFARRHGLSAYDAAYLELAQRLNVSLAAKDSRLALAARKIGLLED